MLFRSWRVVRSGNTSALSLSTPLKQNEWNHIVGTYRSGDQRVFHNGSQVAQTSSNTGRIDRGNGANTIGDLADGSYRTKAIFDDVRIYDRALSAGEVEYLSEGNPSTGSGVYSLGAALSMSGQLSVISGQLRTGNAYDITLSGSWINHAQFTSTGTVTLDGMNQTISGSTVFNNLTKKIGRAHV